MPKPVNTPTAEGTASNKGGCPACALSLCLLLCLLSGRSVTMSSTPPQVLDYLEQHQPAEDEAEEEEEEKEEDEEEAPK